MTLEQKLPTWGPDGNKVCKICPLRGEKRLRVSYAMGDCPDEGVAHCNQQLGSSESWVEEDYPAENPHEGGLDR